MCRHWGCKKLIYLGDGYCDAHRPKPKQSTNAPLRQNAEYKKAREIILTKYPHCQKCWMEGKLVKGSCDHIKPLAQGGTNDVENMQSLCVSCNSSKGNKEIKYPRYVLGKHMPGEYENAQTK